MPQINEYPESTNPSGNWFVVVDDGTGCYKKVKISNLPGGSTPTTSTTTTAGVITTSTTTTAAASTTTSTTTAAIVPTTTSTSTTIAYDPDAIAFFTAAGITNLTQKEAVNSMVLSMKADGGTLWTKMKAIYPFVGGTASSHKYNLKNPADSDAAFRIVFAGSATHDVNGVSFDGISGYGDTKFNPLTQTMAYSMAFGSYSRTTSMVPIGQTYMLLGAANGTVTVNHLQYDGLVGGNLLAGYLTATVGVAVSSVITPRLATISRTSDSSLKLYKEGTLLFTETLTTTGLQPNYSMFIGASNTTGTAANFAALNFAFAFISTGLADGEVASLNTIVNTFQTTLGRAVL